LLSPLSHHRQISRLTEWTCTSVDCTTIKLSISIHVQKPLSCAGPEHTNPNFSCAAPITDDREITITTKLFDTLVHTAPVPLAITVNVQEPLSCTRPEDADVFRARTDPVAD